VTSGDFRTTEEHDRYLWRVEDGTRAQCDGDAECIHVQNAYTMKWLNTLKNFPFPMGLGSFLICDLNVQKPGPSDKFYWHTKKAKGGPNGGDIVTISTASFPYVGLDPRKNGHPGDRQVIISDGPSFEKNCHDSNWCGPHLTEWEALPAFTRPTGVWTHALEGLPLSNPGDKVSFEIDYTKIDTSSHSQTTEEAFSSEVKQGFIFGGKEKLEIKNSVTDAVMSTFQATNKHVVEGTCGGHCDGKTQVNIWQFTLTARQNGGNKKEMKVETKIHQLVKASYPNGPKCVAGCCQDFDCQVCAKGC